MPAELKIPNNPALSFGDKCLGDEGVRTLCSALAKRGDVTSVDLRGCHVHSGGAAALAELLVSGNVDGLSSLSLEWNALGTSDAGPRSLARALAMNCALTNLDLRNNRMGPSAIASLAEGVMTNRTLITLDLRWNSAGSNGAFSLETALETNHTLLRLPLQGNRVPEDAIKRIEKLLMRNGGRMAGSPGAEADENLPPAHGSPPSMHPPLRDAVHAHTLESTLMVQQAEFTNKLRHAQRRANTAEEMLASERTRAEASSERMTTAEASAAETEQQLALVQQELRALQEKSAAEVAAAKQVATNAEYEAERANTSRAQMEEQLAARDTRIAAELKAIADREERASHAEARASEAATQLTALNEKLLTERREHVRTLTSLQERVAEAERVRTEAELRLASADTARAAGIAEALKVQGERHDEATARLRAELGRMEEAVARSEAERGELRAEIERVRSAGEERHASAERAAAERESRAASMYEARIDALSGEKEAMSVSHRDAMAQLREAEEARWTAHEAKLATSREQHAELERRLHETAAAAEGSARELSRAKAELSEAAATEQALREQLARANEAASEAHAASVAELSATRRSWEERLSAATAENQTLSATLLETQRDLQAAHGRWEAATQSLQHKVIQAFQDSVASSRNPAASQGGRSPGAQHSASKSRRERGET